MSTDQVLINCKRGRHRLVEITEMQHHHEHYLCVICGLRTVCVLNEITPYDLERALDCAQCLTEAGFTP